MQELSANLPAPDAPRPWRAFPAWPYFTLPSELTAHETKSLLAESKFSIMKAKSFTENIAESNLIAVELLITDAKVALTLLDLADSAESEETKSRRIREAYHAYLSNLSFLRRLKPTEEQLKILSKEMKTLKTRLKAANVPID